MTCVGLGAVVTPLMIEAVGLRACAVVTAAVLPSLALLALRRLRRIDADTQPPERELELLASVHLFASLAAPALERVARRLSPVAVAAGDAVVREGEAGDRFYLVGCELLDVSRAGRTFPRLSAGSYFGEIALLHGVSRTATVTAATDCELYALAPDDLVATLTAHPRSAQTAAAVVAERFAGRG